MALPSNVLGSGVPALATLNICGDVVTGISAAGTASAGATALTGVHNVLATVASGAGVRMMQPQPGAMVTVMNRGSNPCLVYPYTGGSINGGSADAAVTLTNAKGAMLIGTTTTDWGYIPGA